MEIDLWSVKNTEGVETFFKLFFYWRIYSQDLNTHGRLSAGLMAVDDLPNSL